MRKCIAFLIVPFSLLILNLTVLSQTLSEWRGIGRTGVYNESGLIRQWPAAGPQLLWYAEGLPKGYSSVAVANNTVYFTGLTDSIDLLVALDMTGKLKWQTPIGKSWVYSFPDSRCTPTVEGDRVYVTSGHGDVACVNANTGEIIWKLNAWQKFRGRFSSWGCSESLLLHDDKVLYTAGGDQTTMVALNKFTGETVWTSRTLNDTAVYASPVLTEISGRKLVFNVLANNLFGLDPNSGQILCCFEYGKYHSAITNVGWGGASYTNTNTPLVSGKNIYVTSGYDHVGAMFAISDDFSKLSLEWVDSTLDVHHGGVVLIDGYIYGANWLNNARGNWCCIDWKTGKTMYETTWITKGSIIANDGLLYCYEERTGNIALVKATPEEFKPISSFKVPYGKGPHWSHLVIKDGVLYVRHGDAVMAYSLRE